MSIFNLPQTLFWVANQSLEAVPPDEIETALQGLEDGDREPMSLVKAVLKLSFAKRPRPAPSTDHYGDVRTDALTKDHWENAQRALVANLYKGNLVARGRRVSNGTIEVVRLLNGASTSVGCDMLISDLTIDISAGDFTNTKFVDNHGPTVVPKNFPTATFPAWKFLSFDGDCVRSLWPIRSSSNADARRPGRPAGTGYEGADRDLAKEAIRLKSAGQVPSITAAVKRLIGAAGINAAGAGTYDSKVTRIVKLARKISREK